MTVRVLNGDCRAMCNTLDAETVQSIVTSPPYYQLRSYQTPPQIWGGDLEHVHEWGDPVRAPWANSIPGPNSGGKNAKVRITTTTAGCHCQCGAWLGELGQEPTPEMYVAHIVEAFGTARRVLRKDGVLLLNIGDSSVGSGKGPSNSLQPAASQIGPSAEKKRNPAQFENGQAPTVWAPIPPGYKAKDLYGIPWMVAFALRADGWYLRGDYIWAKPAPMPEHVSDRCTRSHEYVFHLSKSGRYFWNGEGIAEPSVSDHPSGNGYKRGARQSYLDDDGPRGNDAPWLPQATRNKRDVWTINTSNGYSDAEGHYATMPPELAETCILATTRPGDWVLDPFGGSGTTALEADRHGRNAISIDVKAEYAVMQHGRLTGDAPMFADVEQVA